MSHRGYWQNLTDGLVWAIEVENHRPVACAGPLQARDANLELLDFLEYSTSYVDFVERDWSSFVPYRLCSACGRALRPGAATVVNGGTDHVHLRCSFKPGAGQGDSVGAALLVESLWQSSARLRHTSAVLRRGSERLQERSRSARARYVLTPTA